MFTRVALLAAFVYATIAPTLGLPLCSKSEDGSSQQNALAVSSVSLVTGNPVESSLTPHLFPLESEYNGVAFPFRVLPDIAVAAGNLKRKLTAPKPVGGKPPAAKPPPTEAPSGGDGGTFGAGLGFAGAAIDGAGNIISTFGGNAQQAQIDASDNAAAASLLSQSLEDAASLASFDNALTATVTQAPAAAITTPPPVQLAASSGLPAASA